jgi:hypothetical protein
MGPLWRLLRHCGHQSPANSASCGVSVKPSLSWPLRIRPLVSSSGIHSIAAASSSSVGSPTWWASVARSTWKVRSTEPFAGCHEGNGVAGPGCQPFSSSQSRAAACATVSLGSIRPAGSSQHQVSVTNRSHQIIRTRRSTTTSVAAAAAGMRATWWSNRFPYGVSTPTRRSDFHSEP